MIKELAELYEAIEAEAVARAGYYKGETWLEKSGVNGNGAKDAATSEAPELAPEGDNTHTQNNTDPDLTQVDRIKPIWGSNPGSVLVYPDGRREKRDDLRYSDLEKQALVLGWPEPPKGIYAVSNPAFEPQRVAEGRRLQAEWAERMAARS